MAALDDWLETATAAWPCRGAVLKARVCAAEIAANVMEHGSPPGGAAVIEARLTPDGEGVLLELTDDGAAFDPTRPSPTPVGETLETAEPGGRGLRTVQGLATSLAYRREGGRNHLALTIGS